MKNILVTGGAGFIGSAFVRYMVDKYPEHRIVVYDKLTYAGNLANIAPASDAENYRFQQGDIADRETVRAALQTQAIDTIVNFAAETHVDRSILAPDDFIYANVLGVNVLLDEARKHGVERFLQVSTDEVYGDIPNGFSKENDDFAPNSAYAASKASAELLVHAYHVTHGLDTLITRGSNTFGPYQHLEKMIPHFTSRAIDNEPIPLYGDGTQVRDWLYVEDHVTGIEVALHRGLAGEAYNVAGEDLRQNIDVTRRILARLGKPESLVRFVPDREGHDRRYAMNCDKLRALGWQRQFTFEAALEATVRWYVEHDSWWREIKGGEYQEFYKRQYSARLAPADETTS